MVHDDGETERHRLQRSRFVAGNLEPLHLRRNRDAIVSDGASRTTASFREQVPERLARTDQVDCAKERIAAPELQPRLIQPAALDALHRKSNRSACADCVHAEFVAPLNRAQNYVGVAHFAQ